MGAPTVYRWDDSNAPVARGERRSLNDILYACLVTGYGTKPAAGWTREYVNATFDHACYRNNVSGGGLGFFLEVDGVSTSSAWMNYCRGWEAMTSESDGLLPFQTSSTIREARTSDAANTTQRAWVLIADDRFFRLIIWISEATSSIATATPWLLQFGDFIKHYSSDAYNCILGTGGLPGGIYPYETTTEQIYYTYSSPRGVSGAIGPRPINMLSPGVMYAPALVLGATGPVYVPGGELLYGRAPLNDSSAYTFRGWVPGLYIPFHPLSSNLPNMTVISDSGMDLMYFRCYSKTGAAGAFLVQINADWWA